MIMKSSNICTAFTAFYGTAAYQLAEYWCGQTTLEDILGLEVCDSQRKLSPPKFLDIHKYEKMEVEPSSTSVKITHTNKGLFNLTVKHGLLTFIFPNTKIQVCPDEHMETRRPYPKGNQITCHIRDNYDQGGSYVDIAFLRTQIELNHQIIKRKDKYTFVVLSEWYSWYYPYAYPLAEPDEDWVSEPFIAIPPCTIMVTPDMYKDLIKQASIKHTK